ncbi:hypothetical protein [Hymenobacter sp. DG25B]|uniref:hypothetical protein n=1 Tax=Hymenobacter sp. DG25B TaxID=1385664 RepID=UPI000A887C66|nr:hypothetical protein [Hymenobacter sp. DG25B]
MSYISSSFRRHGLPVLVLLLLTAALMYAALGPVLLHPGQYTFAAGGDGTKNYYSLLYHLRYGHGSHFTGMLYPYGEHLVFADGQPLLGIPLAYLQQAGLPVADHGLALLNGLMLLSLPLTAVVVYLLLRRVLLPAAPAVVGALLISFMAPQLERWLGHYALSYAFVVPLLWYLLARALAAPRAWGPLLAFVAVGLLAGLLHPYLVLLTALLGLAFALVMLLQRRATTSAYPLALVARVALAALAPVVLFQGWMALTDSVTDRPSTPYGFLVYRSHFESVFYPVLDPLASFWRAAFRTPETVGEGWAYVGLMSLLVLALTAVKVLRYLLRGKWRLILRPVLPLPLRIGVYAGLLTLLFACGVPFIWGFSWLLEWLKPLKQFRSIGRFAWIFYFFFTVYAVFYFYQLGRYLRQRRAGRFAHTLLLLVVLVWGWEGRTALTTWARRIRNTNADKHYTAQALLHPTDTFIRYLNWENTPQHTYQAIVPLPYFLLGPEQFGSNSMPASAYEAMRASLQTGLPIVASSMSRTSQAQGLAVAQLLSAPELPKALLSALPSRKPFLLLVTQESLTPAEQRLVALGKLLLKDEHVSLYELPVAALEAAPYRQAALAAAPAAPARPDVVRRTWPVSAGAASPLGGGRLRGQQSAVLFEGRIPQAVDTAHYEVSVWVRVVGMNNLPILRVQELDAQTGQPVANYEAPARQIVEVYQGWTRPSVTLRLQNPNNRLMVRLEGDPFEAAHLLIRPAAADVYDQPAAGRTFKNNFPLQD